MNIVFLTKMISVGGVAVVSIRLANRLAKEGHHVSIFAFMPEYHQLSIDMISKDVHVYYGKGARFSKENVRILKEVFEKEAIEIAINQWGLHWFNITCIRAASRNRPIKVITVFHNDPTTNGRLQACDIRLRRCNNTLMYLLLRIKRVLVRWLTGLSMHYVYSMSDAYVLLSDSFVCGFKKFALVYNGNKIRVIPNPITINTPSQINLAGKEKLVLYVGRLDFYQKRVNRLVDVWSQLDSSSLDWKFSIVGDGPMKKYLAKSVKNKNLQRVRLEGSRNPMPYYEKASILLLLSEFEGFGLVLTECMSYGVVPVVLGSYSAVNDIVNDGVNGYIIPYNPLIGFNPTAVAQKVKELMDNFENREMMAQHAIEKSRLYSEDSIINKWIELFDQMKAV